MISVNNLSKTFSSRGGNVKAIDDISFSIKPGTFAAITGKSGSGKSTLLSLLGGLDKPSRGVIGIDSQILTKLHDRALTKYRSRKIGFVFQQFNLIPNLSAIENVMLPMEFAGLKREQRKQRALTLLDQVGINGSKLKRKPAKLSGGEQQRVAIARALANKPDLILADEPTGNLDSETGEQIFTLLRDLSNQEDTTVIIVTHDLAIAGRCDQVLKIADGRLATPKAPMPF